MEQEAAITLASASPRRKQLIEQMKLPVRALPVDIDEYFTAGGPVKDALRLAKQKLNAFLETHGANKHPWVLAADTVVALGDEKIGKPENREDARSILSRLSGTAHTVVTGLAFHSLKKGTTTAHACTEVTFSKLSESEIESYLSLGEWKGVAGGYRIQGVGGCLIEKIHGSYSNVMGLPIRLFYGMLKSHNYPFTG